MGATLEATLPLAALQMALTTRRPGAGLLHHSDRGSQYASTDFGRLLRIGGAADSTISMAGVLVDVAQEDLSALIRDWRGRIVDGRPEAVSVGWRTTVSTVVWVSILLSVRLAASRWRRRPRASPRGES
jgi:hypothetical protein